MTQNPREVYSRLLDERRAEIARREQRHRTLGYLKVAAAVAVGGVLWMALVHIVSIFWVVLPAAVLAALSIFHEHLLRLLERRRRAERYFQRALARLDGNWAGPGEAGERYLDAAHPYAQDLDLFGKGSLFELLSTARTHIGEDTLARWLLAPAGAETVRARHEAVDELRPRLDLREELAIVAEEARTGVDPISLAAWGERAPLMEGRGLRAGVFALTALGVPAGCALVAYVMHQFGLVEMAESTVTRIRLFFLIVMIVNFVSLHRVRRRVQAIIGAVDESAHELKLLSEVLVRLEREDFQSPILAALRASLNAEGDPPSKRLARLKRLTELLDSRDHLVVRVAEPFTLWTTHLAFAVENWRRHNGATVRRWLTATGEIEALCSLASHAFDHPSDPFPEFTAESPMLEADGVAHPFLPEGSAVRNDVRIGG
ncbi:MAG TPA: DNA mismatch repair protein MutS, partial [Candidatus Nitrosotalea sp.]|nr:DNA mismatch repair protein MutS [Candidatus Nitrosotalea sp.]